MTDEIKNQMEIVKQRMIYHFKTTNGDYLIPKELPFMKEFFKEIDTLVSLLEEENKAYSIKLSKENITEWKKELKKLSKKIYSSDFVDSLSDEEWLETYIENTPFEAIQDDCSYGY